MKINLNSHVSWLQGTRSTWSFYCLLDDRRLLTREISRLFYGFDCRPAPVGCTLTLKYVPQIILNRHLNVRCGNKKPERFMRLNGESELIMEGLLAVGSVYSLIYCFALLAEGHNEIPDMYLVRFLPYTNIFTCAFLVCALPPADLVCIKHAFPK